MNEKEYEAAKKIADELDLNKNRTDKEVKEAISLLFDIDQYEKEHGVNKSQRSTDGM